MPDTPTSLQLPGILGELARRGYGGQALALAKSWGGTKRYIPPIPREGMALVAIIGLDAAQALAEIIAGMCGDSQQDIPRAAGLESVKIEILGHPGGTRATAMALGCTERYVRMVRNSGEHRDDHQPGLFD